MSDVPEGSIDTGLLSEKDMGVNWENAYRNREAILELWTKNVVR